MVSSTTGGVAKETLLCGEEKILGGGGAFPGSTLTVTGSGMGTTLELAVYLVQATVVG